MDIEAKKWEPRVNVALFNTGEVVECVDVAPRVFNTYLIDEFNMSFVRGCRVGRAIEKLYNECTPLDSRNRDRLMRLTLAEVLDLYGTKEEMYNHFQEEANKND
jgi:hypothetical protein